MHRNWLTTALGLWVVFMVSYGYFFQATNPNIAPRIALAISIADRHALTLGPFASSDIDEAFVNGAYYSDKAPGLSFLAAPLAAAVVAAMPSAGRNSLWFTGDCGFTRYYFLVVYVSNVVIVAGLSALALAGLFLWCLLQGASRGAALAATVGLGLCSPFWGWSTVFVGHAPAGALLFIGFALLSMEADDAATGRAAYAGAVGLLAGLVLGAAFVIEFTAGPAVAIVGIVLHRIDAWPGAGHPLPPRVRSCGCGARGRDRSIAGLQPGGVRIGCQAGI